MTEEVYRLTAPDGSELELPVHKGTTGPDVIDIRQLYGKEGVFTFDPGFAATASCESKITFIDGEKGVLMRVVNAADGKILSDEPVADGGGREGKAGGGAGPVAAEDAPQ